MRTVAPCARGDVTGATAAPSTSHTPPRPCATAGLRAAPIWRPGPIGAIACSLRRPDRAQATSEPPSPHFAFAQCGLQTVRMRTNHLFGRRQFLAAVGAAPLLLAARAPAAPA